MILSLKDFLKRFGEDTTSNIQLLNFAKQLKIKPFKVLMRNELKNISKNDFVIVNLQKSNEPGVHWVCFHKNYYFDSFGLPPINEVINVMRNLDNRVYSSFNIQEFGQRLCGQLCLFVLYKLFHKQDFFNTIIDIYSFKNE